MTAPPAPQNAKACWTRELLLICEECEDGMRGGVDGDGARLSRWLHKALKRAGRDDEIRVQSCACLDLCPKRAVALMCASDAASPRPLQVFRRGDDPQVLLEWLLHRVDHKTGG